MSPIRPAQSMGYYIPPPGYPSFGSKEDTASYERMSPHKIRPADFGKDTAAQWIEQNMMPALSHHDWSIPQAKQILSHWATLATLLAGTQATLMGYYKNNGGQMYHFVIACPCAGFFLEVYGALLSAATIITGISLQAPHSMTSSSSRQPAKKPLSPRAAAFLDQLTVACGYIVPLGVLCELVGLAAYAAHYQNKLVVISMGVTLFFCACATCLAALFGWRVGSERMEVMRGARQRAFYWDHSAHRGKGRDDESQLIMKREGDKIV